MIEVISPLLQISFSVLISAFFYDLGHARGVGLGFGKGWDKGWDRRTEVFMEFYRDVFVYPNYEKWENHNG